MPSEIETPKLPISYYVRGRRSRGTRVEYLLDPTGADTATYEIPEQIVLKRWRKRKVQTSKLGGMRLNPNIWKSINMALGGNAENIANLSCQEIDNRFSASKEDRSVKNFPSSNGFNIQKIIKGVGIEKFQVLLDRHSSEKSVYGTPDLFLWSLTPIHEIIQEVFFVEVKRPTEQLKDHQKNELFFLRDNLKLNAILLRLREV